MLYLNFSLLCLFSTSKRALISLCNAFIIWLFLYCYLRVDTLYHDVSGSEHLKIMEELVHRIVAIVFEIALQVVLQVALSHQEFTIIGSATTMNFLFIVYHGTQIVKSQLEWINVIFSIVLTTVGLFCLYTLYRMIQLQKEEENVEKEKALLIK